MTTTDLVLNMVLFTLIWASMVGSLILLMILLMSGEWPWQ